MIDRPLRIVHVITGLDVGGAERSLQRLVVGLDRERYAVSVVSLTGIGEIGAELIEAGVDVRALGMRGSRGVPGALGRLRRHLRQAMPDVVQTWLYDADLLGGLAARLASVPSTVWSLRQAELPPSTVGRRSRVLVRVNARLSRHLPAAIVACSDAAEAAHLRRGYTADRMTVIPNGFVVPPPDVKGTRRAAGRDALGLPSAAPVIGRVGRFHPHKDYPTLLGALRLLAPDVPDLHVVLCGEGVVSGESSLDRLCRESGMGERVHLLGMRTDVDVVLAALDLAVSSSVGEGFPNVVAEAMALGVPGVVTDVGESAVLVGDTGWVVGPADPPALARAIGAALQVPEAERARRGEAAQRRIRDRYGLVTMTKRYAELYDRLAGRVALDVPVPPAGRRLAP